jgi:hypothetical protein
LKRVSQKSLPFSVLSKARGGFLRENPGTGLAWFWHIRYGNRPFSGLNLAGSPEKGGVFRQRGPSKKTPKGFQVSMEGQISPPGKINCEEKAAEQVIFPTIRVIFERSPGFLWPDSMIQMI